MPSSCGFMQHALEANLRARAGWPSLRQQMAAFWQAASEAALPAGALRRASRLDCREVA